MRARRRKSRCSRSRCEPSLNIATWRNTPAHRCEPGRTPAAQSLRAERSPPATQTTPKTMPPRKKPAARKTAAKKRKAPEAVEPEAVASTATRPRHERGRPQGALRLDQDRDGVRAVPRLGRALFGGGARGFERGAVSRVRALLLFFGGRREQRRGIKILERWAPSHDDRYASYVESLGGPRQSIFRNATNPFRKRLSKSKFKVCLGKAARDLLGDVPIRSEHTAGEDFEQFRREVEEEGLKGVARLVDEDGDCRPVALGVPTRSELETPSDLNVPDFSTPYGASFLRDALAAGRSSRQLKVA